MITEKTILPYDLPFQSFTGSKEVANEIAEEFAENNYNIILSSKPSPKNVMFGIKDLRASSYGVGWVEALSDWFWQDEVVVKVDSPLPIKNLIQYKI